MMVVRSACFVVLLGLLLLPVSVRSQEWALDPNPVFSIGGATEDPAYILSDVVGGLVLDDGRVVLADRFTNGLRMYSPDGTFLEKVGGEGGGPGEFEHIRGMDRCAGYPVVAFDLHWDLKTYDGDLRLAEERDSFLPGLSSTPYRFDCSESGYWIATGWGDVRVQFKEGFFQATAPVVLGRGDTLIFECGERLSSERIGTMAEDGSGGGSRPHPFGRETQVALGEDRAFLGDGRDYEIEVYDLTGAPLPPIRWEGPDLMVTREHLELYAEDVLAGVPAERRPAYRRWLRDMPEVEKFPAYDMLRVAPSGDLWVHAFQRPGEASSSWTVFDRVREKIGSLTLPDRMTLLDAGQDFLLVLELDEWDVLAVSLLRYSRR